MCGLVALHTIEKTGFLTHHKDELKHLMILNSVRGIHSTGLAGVDMQDAASEVNMVKSTGSPYNLFSYNHADTFLARMVASFTTVIGHGRFATRGDVNAINAHPFKEGHITLAHNGVISNYFELKDYKRHANIDVDSHLIAKLFEEEGALNVLPRIEGAYVFIWYDKSDNTLNIARNNERPLFVATQKARQTLYFASEAESLLWNATRNRTEVTSIDEIPSFTLHKYYNDNLTPELIRYEQVKKPLVVAPSNYGQGYYTGDGEFVRYGTPSNSYVKTASNLLPKDLTGSRLNAAITSNHGFKIGDKITASFEDYESLGHGFVALGYNDNYPLCIFKSVMPNAKELDFYDAESFKGEVSLIQANQDMLSPFPWVVYLAKGELLTLEADRVDIVYVDETPSNITRERLRELSEDGCGWCTSPITDKELFSPSTIRLQTVEGSEDCVICSDCTAKFLGGSSKPH